MNEKELEREILANIKSASTLVSVGLLGLFFPVIAWICCGIAMSRLSLTRELLEDNERLFNKYVVTVKDKYSSAFFLIIVTVLIAVAWFFFSIQS